MHELFRIGALANKRKMKVYNDAKSLRSYLLDQDQTAIWWLCPLTGTLSEALRLVLIVMYNRQNSINLLYKAEKLSVRLPAVFWSSGSPPWMQGSTSSWIEIKRPSSGNMKFNFFL